ncbi:hypothetical protein M2284_004818 [Rhodococcus sp. LBL1]|nr:hypothetical protein [Rhodococcus sp. LBL1]MDH6686090.1 hypothetical protein [Rhodococcus sp. LBL2]
MGCPGVSRIAGLGITATGYASLRGEHIARDRLRPLLERKGASFHPDFCSRTEILVVGYYRDGQLRDDRIGGVDALAQLAELRGRRGRHVHLVWAEDLDALLAGSRVPCRQVPRW